MNLDFLRGKKILLTGHTGFKGSWLSKILIMAGANVTGYALLPDTKLSLYEILSLKNHMNSVIADIRDYEKLYQTYKTVDPDFVYHLAAQPLVSKGYKSPRETYEINIMGTVNLFECTRKLSSNGLSMVNVTTDKVYENKEWHRGYREKEILNGFDPYSNSKSCSELVTNSYKKSFFLKNGVSVSTARAGNVIGGGDFSENRIIPDCIRAVDNDKTIMVRKPNSIRPYQHVLEPLVAYLLISKMQINEPHLTGAYNVGPEIYDCLQTKELVNKFCKIWGGNASWKKTGKTDLNFHEAGFLKLDCSLIKEKFNWSPIWGIDEALERTIHLSKLLCRGGNVKNEISTQIEEYLSQITHF